MTIIVKLISQEINITSHCNNRHIQQVLWIYYLFVHMLICMRQIFFQAHQGELHSLSVAIAEMRR